MKLRVLICLFLLLIVVSDITAVAATDYYRVNIVMQGYIAAPSQGELRNLYGHVDINGIRIINRQLSSSHCGVTNTFSFIYNSGINTIRLSETRGRKPDGTPFVRTASFRIYKGNVLLASGVDTFHNLGRIHTLNIPHPNLVEANHALNFTLATAMAIPTMTVDIVDDIMLIVGKYIKCCIAKFTIRAALLKFAAKGVAVTVAIAGISYLLAEFADEIYYSIFASIPEVQPGDTVFHESEIHQVMDVINTHFPVTHAMSYAIEQSIWEQVDAHGMILISEVMTVLQQKHEEIIHDIYKETPGFFPTEIIVNKEQVPEIMELIDEYFPVEFPIRNIIEQTIYREIYNDEFNEIPFSTIIDIIEQEQNIYIPELPTETPQEQHEYIERLIDKVIYEDVFIPISATPFIFEGIPATPTVPRIPKRPKEKIHTFPFYSIFVDPLASVIGITLAHLFTAMMIIGAIISIGAAWGGIGAIIAGFIGTITTAYFGLTSWLIPVFLIIILIIYANIRIKTGVGKE